MFKFILHNAYGQSSTDEKYNLLHGMQYCIKHNIKFDQYMIYVINTDDGRPTSIYSYLYGHYYPRKDPSPAMSKRDEIFDTEVLDYISKIKDQLTYTKLHQSTGQTKGHLCIKY